MLRFAALAALATVALVGCGSASADTQRDCGRIAGTHTGRLKVEGGGTCVLARHTYRRISLLTVANDGPYSGPVKVDGIRMVCTFHRRSHVVYDCPFNGGRVIVWAGRRT